MKGIKIEQKESVEEKESEDEMPRKNVSLVAYEDDDDETSQQPMDVTDEVPENGNDVATVVTPTPSKEAPVKPNRSAIYIFDSLRGSVSCPRIYTAIREYLTEEFLDKKKFECAFDYSNMRGFYPQVPQQLNYSDCGVFVLEYARCFLQKPPSVEQVCAADLKGFKELFDPMQVTKKRRNELGDIIFKLHESQFPGSTLRQEYTKSRCREEKAVVA